jgi:hypothetical protein
MLRLRGRRGLWLHLRTLFAQLLALSSSHHAVVIEVLGIETSERLSLELLKSEGVSGRESLVEHPLDASSAAAIVAPLRLELGCGLLRLSPGNEAVMVGVEHLEQHVGALLGFRAGSVPSSARALCQKRGRHKRCAERDRGEQSLHAFNPFDRAIHWRSRCSCAAKSLQFSL